jgi:hypothetical protein
VVSIGSTSGGTQIVSPMTVTSASTLTVIGGEAIASLGADMTILNGYEAIYSSGQNIFCNITVTGIVTAGDVDIYLYGLPLPN